MSPAKKRKTAKRKRAPRAAPVSLPPPPVPPPVLTKQERRFWRVIQTKNLIGGTMFLMGIAFALGYIASDKAHLHEKVALYAAGLFMLAGAHFLSSEPTERLLKAAVNTVKGTRNPPPVAAGEQ